MRRSVIRAISALNAIGLVACPAMAQVDPAARGLAVRALTGVPRPVVCATFIGQSVTHGNVTVAMFTGSISTSGVLTVSTISTAQGQIEVGDVISGSPVFNGARVTAQLTGASMGAGTYQLDKVPASSVPSQTMYATFTQAFASQANPSVTAPLPGARSASGGAFLRLYDAMHAWGYDFRIVNGAKGSMSLVSQGAGSVSYWAPQSQGFFNRRTSANFPDRGFFGNVIVPFGNKVFVVTAGRNTSVMGDGPFLSPAASSQALDFLQYEPTTNLTSGSAFTASAASGSNVLTVSAQSKGTIVAGQYIQGAGALYGLYVLPFGTNSTTGTGGTGTYALSGDTTGAFSGSIYTGPDFYTPNVIGTTVADGGYTWTLVANTAAAYGGVGGAVLNEGQAGYGFDPYGILAAAHEQTQAQPGCMRKFAYIDGNQSDLAQTTISRQGAVNATANYFLGRGYEVMIGNMIYSPGSGTVLQHTTQNSANASALASLQAGRYGSRVYAGADLYTALGTTLVSQGLMTPDQIHLNGTGSMLQGDAYAAAFKSVLPQIRR